MKITGESLYHHMPYPGTYVPYYYYINWYTKDTSGGQNNNCNLRMKIVKETLSLDQYPKIWDLNMMLEATMIVWYSLWTPYCIGLSTKRSWMVQVIDNSWQITCYPICRQDSFTQ